MTGIRSMDLSIRGFRTSSTLDETHDIVCPAFAESITEGTLKWEKAQCDSVAVDDVICEIETDKTSVPVPSPVSGVIEKLLVEDDATVNPGTALARIAIGEGGAPPAPKKEAPAPAAAAPPPPPPPVDSGAIPTTPPPVPPPPTEPIASMPIAAIRHAQAQAAPQPPPASGGPGGP